MSEMYTVTKEQDDKILRAIGLSRYPGYRYYVWGGEPCCIIAQLAHIEGMSVAVLSEWDSVPLSEDLPNAEILTAYDHNLLGDLQKAWDEYKWHTNEDDARKGLSSLYQANREVA